MPNKGYVVRKKTPRVTRSFRPRTFGYYNPKTTRKTKRTKSTTKLTKSKTKSKSKSKSKSESESESESESISESEKLSSKNKLTKKYLNTWKNRAKNLRTKKNKITELIKRKRETELTTRLSRLFRKKRENLDFTSHRTQRINSIKEAFKTKENQNLLSIQNNHIVSNKIFDVSTIKILSKPNQTSSGSLVFSIKSKEGLRFILKLSSIDDDDTSKLNFPFVEYLFYSLMNSLIRKNLTPHVFRGVEKLDIFNSNNLKNYHYRKYFNNEKMFGMLNEGGVYKDIYTLRDFFKQKKLFMSLLNSDPHLMHHSFMNILFQIIYTLHIFKKINFKHNDLHTSNIMILINEFNIYSNNEISFYNSYEFKANKKNYKVFLNNTGLSVRIYDFDRSCFYDTKSKKYLKADLFSELLEKFGQNCDMSIETDVYKILCHLYFEIYDLYEVGYHHKNRKYLSSILGFIQSLFKDKSILLNGITSEGQKIEYKVNDHRYYLLLESVKDKMYSIETILEKLSNYLYCEVDGKENRKKDPARIFQSYSDDTSKFELSEEIIENLK